MKKDWKMYQEASRALDRIAANLPVPTRGEVEIQRYGLLGNTEHTTPAHRKLFVELARDRKINLPIEVRDEDLINGK